MGSSTSKPDTAGSRQQVFSADHPVQFSESLANSLQSNAETDSTRARNSELIIQQRVTSELEKHLKASTSRLAELSDSISKEPLSAEDQQAAPQRREQAASWTDKPLATRIAEKLRGDRDSEEGESIAKAGTDRGAVAKEIEDLKGKLEGRKRKVKMDREVERAKEEVIICLRKNDRRPLDCWEEVERFKREVGRLERRFVDANAG